MDSLRPDTELCRGRSRPHRVDDEEAGAQPVIVALVSEEQFFLYSERGFSIQRDNVVDDPLSDPETMFSKL